MSEIDNSIDISSIFMVIVNKKRKNIHYFSLLVVLLLTTLIGLIIMYDAYQNILTAPTLHGKNVCALQFLVGISLIFEYFCLIFVCDWKRVVEFLNIWTATGLQDDQEIVTYIKSERKKYRLIIFSLTVVYAIVIVLFNPQYGHRLQQISIYQTIAIIIISYSSPTFLSLAFDLPLQFVLFICSVFMRVNQRLKHLNEFPDSLDDNIRSIRLMHSLGAQLTLEADKFIRYFTAVNYFLMISFMLINLYNILYQSESSTDYYIGIGVQLVAISVTSILIHYTVKINHLASQGFHHVYQLTFTQTCPNNFAETSLLLYRMGRNDIGLTFANLFTITVSFITSLVTLSITFILAFPTIKSQF